MVKVEKFVAKRYTITSILDPSNLSQTPDISSRLSNQFVLYIVNLRQIYPKPLFYPQIPNDRSEYKIEVMVYNFGISQGAQKLPIKVQTKSLFY